MGTGKGSLYIQDVRRSAAILDGVHVSKNSRQRNLKTNVDWLFQSQLPFNGHLAKARFRRRTFHEPNPIRSIKYTKSSESE